MKSPVRVHPSAQLVFALATVVALVLACGGGSDDPAEPQPTQPSSGGVTAVASPSDVPGSKDFTDVPRFPGSWIATFDVEGRSVRHCGGLRNDFIAALTGQEYKLPAGVDSKAVVEFYKNELPRRGWTVKTASNESVIGERDQIDCGDGVVKARQSVAISASGDGYEVSRSYLEGTDPYQ